jgi:EmrB/QacA subfamily drug resistance transporter
MQFPTSTRSQDVGQQPASKLDEHYLYSRHTIIFTLIGTMLITFIAILDQTIVGTALPRIVADLHGFDLIAWITIIYLLTSTVTIPIYGKLSDLFGRKPIFLFGIVVFLIGSILSGAAQSMTQLVIFRGLQGIGAGGLQPIASAVVGDLFPPRERGKWQGITSSTYALASIVGPLAGGWLTDSFSWRWVFYINVPLGVIALFVLIFLMPVSGKANRQIIIDYAGALLLVLGVLPLLLGLSWAGDKFAWLSFQSLGLFGGALAVLILLVIYSARQERLGREPIVEPSMFKNSVRIFSISLMVTMLISVALLGSVYFIPLFLQSVVGVSATNSGLTLMPMMLTAIVGSVISGLLVSVTGRYKWVAVSGVLITIAGILLLRRLDIHATNLDVIIGMFVLGLGIGSGLSVYTVIVQNVTPEKIGQATAALAFFRQLGQSIGLAAIGAVVTTSYVTAFHNALPAPLKQPQAQRLVRVFDDPSILLSQDALRQVRASFASYGPQGTAAFHALLDAVKVGLTESIHNGFMLSLELMILAFVMVCFLKELPLRSRKDMAQSARESQLHPVSAGESSK